MKSGVRPGKVHVSHKLITPLARGQVVIGASMSELHTSELNCGFFIYIAVLRVPYVCLDCNLTQQPRAASGQSKISTYQVAAYRSWVFQRAKWRQKHLTRKNWSVSNYCMRADSCVNKPGYSQQKVVDILQFVYVFSMLGDFPLLYAKTGCVFTEDRGQQKAASACV